MAWDAVGGRNGTERGRMMRRIPFRPVSSYPAVDDRGCSGLIVREQYRQIGTTGPRSTAFDDTIEVIDKRVSRDNEDLTMTLRTAVNEAIPADLAVTSSPVRAETFLSTGTNIRPGGRANRVAAAVTATEYTRDTNSGPSPFNVRADVA